MGIPCTRLAYPATTPQAWRAACRCPSPSVDLDPMARLRSTSRWLRVAALALLAALAACSSSTKSGEAVPDHIKVSPPLVSLGLGGTQQVTAVVYDSRDSVITGAVVAYQSGDTTVARVSASGLVTGVGSGITAVTVRSAPAVAAVVVNVSSGVKTIALSPDSSILTGANTLQLTAVGRDSLGNVTTAPISFASYDSTIVAVSSTGLVLRRGVGSTYVLATSGPVRDSVLVTALIARVGEPDAGFAGGVFSETRGYVTLKNLGGAQLLDLSTPGNAGAALAVGQLPTSMAINAAGTRAYVGNQTSGSVSVINTVSGAVIGTIPIGTLSVLSVFLAPGDSLLFVGTDAANLYVVRLSTSAIIDSIRVANTNNMALRSSTVLLANDVFYGYVYQISLATRQVLDTMNVGGRPQGMVVSQDGTTLYLANEIGQVQRWNLSTLQETGFIPLPTGGGFGLARSPANGLLYVSTSYIGSVVHVIDPVAGQIVRTIVVGGTPRYIAFTADGSVGIVPNEGGWVDYIK